MALVWARLAAFTVKQKGFAAVAPLVPHLMRRVVAQAAAERAGAEVDEMTGASAAHVCIVAGPPCGSGDVGMYRLTHLMRSPGRAGCGRARQP